MDMNLSKLQEIVEDKEPGVLQSMIQRLNNNKNKEMLSFKFQMKKYNRDLGK